MSLKPNGVSVRFSRAHLLWQRFWLPLLIWWKLPISHFPLPAVHDDFDLSDEAWLFICERKLQGIQKTPFSLHKACFSLAVDSKCHVEIRTLKLTPFSLLSALTSFFFSKTMEAPAAMTDSKWDKLRWFCKGMGET